MTTESGPAGSPEELKSEGEAPGGGGERVMRVQMASGEEVAIPLGTFTAGRSGLGSVRAVTKWWGFELHLDQLAVEQTQALRGIIADAVGHFLPSPLAEVISVVVIAQDYVIKQVSKGHGCKLVSPWVSPTMLIPRPLQPPATPLQWTVFEEGEGWNEATAFPRPTTGSHPALAVYQGKLYCVHRGLDNNSHLYWEVFDPSAQNGWSAANKFPHDMKTYSGPTLTVFNGKLYCAFRGDGKNTGLYLTSFNGTSWSSPTQIPNSSSPTSPALATFGGKLYLAYRSNVSTDIWLTSTTNGTTWTPRFSIHPNTASVSPALAVYRDQLYCVGRGTTTTLWWARTDNGSAWTPPQNFPNHHSSHVVSLAAFKDKLYCLHQGGGDQYLWWTAFDGSRWSTDTRLSAHRSPSGPALVVYRDQNGLKDQLLSVYRGTG